MMKNILIFRNFIFSLILSSCSSYIDLIESKPSLKILKSPTIPQYCTQKAKLQIAHEDLSAHQKFLRILQKMEKRHRLSFYEKAVLLTFYQMLIRPKATHNFSRLQIIYGSGEKLFYRDYPKATLFEALQLFLEENKKRRSLISLASLADQYFLTHVSVTGRPNSLKKLIRRSRSRASSQNRFPPPPLFAYGKKINCNMDFKLYDQSIFFVSPEEDAQINAKTNAFALYRSQRHFFIAITRPHNHWPIPFCSLQGEKGQWKIALLAMKNRDSRQLLFHLIQKDLQEVGEASHLAQIIRSPRHQTLKGPERVFFEWERGDPSFWQKKFLQQKFPLYYSPRLGEVWGLLRKQNQQLELVTDDRYPTPQTCQ